MTLSGLTTENQRPPDIVTCQVSVWVEEESGSDISEFFILIASQLQPEFFRLIAS